MDAMTMKMDAQYKEFQSRSKQPHLDHNDDDKPMSSKEDAKFMQTFRHIRFYNDCGDWSGVYDVLGGMDKDLLVGSGVYDVLGGMDKDLLVGVVHLCKNLVFSLVPDKGKQRCEASSPLEGVLVSSEFELLSSENTNGTPSNLGPDLNGKAINETQYRGFDLKGYLDSDYVGCNMDRKSTLEFMTIVDVNNHPPMLEKSLYDSWKSRMEFYMENKENEIMILDSVQNATNIVLQGLPLDVYAIVNHHKVTKEIWDRVKLLMHGTKLSLQEKEYKLYDEFDKFTFVKDETLYQYYWRFSQLINNMNVINMSMRPVQVNTKFLNSLPPEWSLAIPMFNQGDDPITCLNKAMAFLIVAASSWFPSTNNQLKTSFNLRNQRYYLRQKGYCATSLREERTKLC
nr:putative zinc finger, CCHC-type [Tanacetum cinerariifolium]